MQETRQQLEILANHGVDYVVVGRVAAALHGSSIPDLRSRRLLQPKAR